MVGRTVARLALGWTILALILLGAILANIKAFTLDAPSKADVAAVAAKIPDVGLGELDSLACDYVRIQAADQGVAIRSCKLKTVKKKGDKATVTVAIVTALGPFTVRVNLQRSLWTVVDWGVAS